MEYKQRGDKTGWGGKEMKERGKGKKKGGEDGQKKRKERKGTEVTVIKIGGKRDESKSMCVWWNT